jgi:hypothetical protein
MNLFDCSLQRQIFKYTKSQIQIQNLNGCCRNFKVKHSVQKAIIYNELQTYRGRRGSAKILSRHACRRKTRPQKNATSLEPSCSESTPRKKLQKRWMEKCSGSLQLPKRGTIHISLSQKKQLRRMTYLPTINSKSQT